MLSYTGGCLVRVASESVLRREHALVNCDANISKIISRRKKRDELFAIFFVMERAKRALCVHRVLFAGSSFAALSALNEAVE